MHSYKEKKMSFLTELVWLFMFGAFFGAMIEIVFVFMISGKLMSRSSLLYGQFSVIWGLGCVIMTIAFKRLRGKRDLTLFGFGTIVGGLYEYVCSLFTEIVFGVKFWDYSGIPFNLNGRINLLYCFFWGIAAVIWVQNVYPFFISLIERVRGSHQKAITVSVALFMSLNILVTSMALTRAYARTRHIPARNFIEAFLDETYPDSYLKQRYQNML